MHILFVANYAPPYGGGIQYVIAELTRRLVAAGHQVTIAASDTGIPRGISTWEGATRIGIPAANFLEAHGIPYPILNPLTLWQTLSEVLPHVDVVHIHGFLYMTGIMAAWWAKRFHCRIILTEHVGIVPYTNPVIQGIQILAVHTLGRFTLRRADALIVLNKRVVSELRPFLKPPTPILKIPNGVDVNRFHPPLDRLSLRARLNLHRPTVIFVGRLTAKKGVYLVIDAARHLPDLDFLICGQDTDRLQNTPANVRLLGKVDQSVLADLFGASDILLLPSVGEGFPLVIQEALACGLPVMITDDSTNREYLDEQVAVFISRSIGSITQAIQHLFADPTSLNHMRAAALSWASSHFDWSQTLAAYLELYQPSPAQTL